MMRAFFAVGLLFGFAMAQAQGSGNGMLMPQPRRVSSAAGALAWSKAFSVATSGVKDVRLDAALGRMLQRLEDATGDSISKEIGRNGGGATLVVEVSGPGKPVQTLDEDESYSLTVTTTGIRLHAATVVGAMRGMETLLQLLQAGASGYSFPAVTIEDAPRFRWRGLMIDCARHFEPLAVLKRTLDGMASVKLNVFHWHLSDDQGFRMESRQYAKLTGVGSDGLFYTQDEARELVAYARARGIRVVPEFDMPGHTRSWFVGYPELASGSANGGGSYTLRREFGIDDAAMDPTRESTYAFLDGLIGEMSGIFPDPYFHIGGDESNGKQWASNAAIREFMRAHSLSNAAALQAYFNQRVVKILTKYSKRMVGWDEVLNPGLPKTAVVQSWRGAKSLEESAREGFDGILSQPYYLDAMRSAESYYLADPLPSSSTLTTEQQARVLGGEICMWAEQVDSRSIDSRVWPRAAAIAERFWSAEGVRDADDMYRRLAVESVRLEGLGLTHVSHEGQALRVLAGSAEIGPLENLASVIEPISFGERYHQQRTSQLTPLTSMVDAVRPDPPSRHGIERMTQEFLAAPRKAGADAALQGVFTAMLGESPAIAVQVRSTPVLRRVQPLAVQLPKLAATGLEAVKFIASGAKAPVGWKKRQMALLEASKRPETLVRFTFLGPLQALVNAVAE